MAIHPYLFRLRPADTFFFGGERSFGYDGDRSRLKDNANYFVISNPYPQQTSLLGMLRYKLLEAKGWLAIGNQRVPDEAKDWIGQRGFQVSIKPEDNQAFGHIYGLSPLFWLHQDRPCLPAPFDRGMTVAWQTETMGCYLGGAREREIVPFIEHGYDPKQGLKRQLVDRNGGAWSFDDVYRVQTQEGILKKENRTEDEQGFYKQQYYRFVNADWAFAFVSYLGDDAATTLTNHLKTDGWVTLGGEGRPFRLVMEPISDVANLFTLPASPVPASGRSRLTLLSDAYVSNAIYDHCDFAISDVVDFRAIETNTQVTNYANLNRTNKQNPETPHRGQKYHLLERGSVFFAQDSQLADLQKLLKAPTHFRRIGYNAYHLTGYEPDLFQPTNS